MKLIDTWGTNRPELNLPFTHERIAVSVGDFNSDGTKRKGKGLVERWIARTKGDTYDAVLSQGLPKIATIVFRKGNGRNPHGPSLVEPLTATGFGAYMKEGAWEGGIESTATYILQGARKGWPIEYIEWCNEDPLPFVLWLDKLRLVIRTRDRIAPQVKVLVGFGLDVWGWNRMRAGAAEPGVNAVGPHLLNSRSFNRDLNAAMGLAVDRQLECLVTEHRPMMGPQYRDSLERMKLVGVDGIAAFADGLNPWGVKFAPPYSLYENGVETGAAAIWRDFAAQFGNGEPGPSSGLDKLIADMRQDPPLKVVDSEGRGRLRLVKGFEDVRDRLDALEGRS